jgi:hypothetical protein
MLWDVHSDGHYLIECDKATCDLYGDPVAVAEDLGLPIECVHQADVDLSEDYRGRRLAA